MSEIYDKEKENSNNFSAGQMFGEFENEKSNVLAKSIEERSQEDIASFNSSFVNEENSSNSICSAFSGISYVMPIYILCSSCNEYFDIISLNMEYIDIECGCRFFKNCPINEFKRRKDNDFNFDFDKYGCKSHYKNNLNERFVKYCQDCKKDLCKQCLKEIAKYNNDTRKHTTHETHDLIDLNINDKEIEETINLIESLNFEKKSEKNLDPEKKYLCENDEEPTIKRLILDLLKCYKERPSYSGYKAIKVSKEFLSHPFKQKIEKNLQPEELIKINSIKELKENIKSFDKFYKIIIEGEETKEEIENLDILKNKDFTKLEEIQINTIKKLNNIDALASCTFPELRVLVIGETELNDKCIDIIKKLKLPKIKFISLFDNKITSPEIFGAVEEFNTLEKYYIGFNQIDTNKLPNKNIIYNFPKNLVELGISKMFNENNNSFITEHLNLENIKLLYVSGNKISSLKIFEKTNFNQLEEFWMRGSEKVHCLESIEDIKYLKDKKTIKKIVVKQNNIKDIEKLVDIISSFKNLELFNIEDNDIEKERIEYVIKKIKEKGEFKKLEFKY